MQIYYDLDKISQLGLSVQEIDTFIASLNQKFQNKNYLVNYKERWIILSILMSLL